MIGCEPEIEPKTSSRQSQFYETNNPLGYHPIDASLKYLSLFFKGQQRVCTPRHSSFLLLILSQKTYSKQFQERPSLGKPFVIQINVL